ncbi:hypothetical protein BDZ97DRAFT_1652701, partial [Flammula alnicola]
CEGYIITLPANSSPYALYPVGLHLSHTLPWTFEFQINQIIFRAWSCKKFTAAGSHACSNCIALAEHGMLKGIVTRLVDGVNENAGYAFHGTLGLLEILRRKDKQISHLRTKALTQARIILTRSAALDGFKRFMVAIASAKAGNVERLVRVALKQNRSIRAILELYHRAAEGIYHPKSFSEEDDMRGLLLWLLGGNRIAGIASRALGLPALTTLRNRAIMPPLIPSHSTPAVSEVTKNIDACFESIGEILASRKVVHQVLMFDEIATEKRIRWDDHTNNFLGVCREHGKRTALEFSTVDDMKELFNCLETGEATVAALGLLGEDTRIYAGRPILISGDCKRETGAEHAKVIQTVFDAADGLKEKTGLRIVSIASDGETRRGASLVQMTFKKQLEETSPIYEILKDLTFMDFHTGNDDVTADKDWKHVDKRIRNYAIRARGIVIRDFRITPAIIINHLKSEGHSAVHINSLFQPDDSQDVKLAFDLLKDIWTLPMLSTHSNPSFLAARHALCTLGKLLYHIIFPYLCTELSLSEQLEHLSAAAHLALVLYYDNGKDFMPTLLYQDLAIMIKNVFFCVAKAKIDDPNGKFFVILLGTDRLEELFGILRTMVGNDSNLDIYQLASRLTGTTQVSNILAKYPQWDRAPRRLKLPAITRSSETLPDTVDHIKPASWKGDVYVKNVTLLTAWRRGRHLVEKDCSFAAPILEALEQKGSHHILAPRGKLLFRLTPEEAGEDDSLDLEEISRPHRPSAISDELDDNRVEIEDSFVEQDHGDTVLSQTADSGRKFDRHIEFEGTRMLKSRALSLYSKRLGKDGPSSTDRLKRVQEVERYAGSTPLSSAYGTTPSSVSQPLLVIQDPVATVVRCQDHLFLCIGEVNGIKINSDSAITAVPQADLYELEKITVSIQVLGLRPSTSDDDISLQNDWRSYRIKELTLHVPGKYIQAMDPEFVSRGIGQMFYLFQGTFLVGLAAMILGQLTSNNIKELARIPHTDNFPYREHTGTILQPYCY